MISIKKREEKNRMKMENEMKSTLKLKKLSFFFAIFPL